LTQADADALDFLESVFHRKELAVTFQMERGDMQFVNNRFVLHSRTAFEDHAEPDRRRHFLRLWMRYKV
jgi:alpha-ketoglutarate-dependent taurine dioxygenase